MTMALAFVHPSTYVDNSLIDRVFCFGRFSLLCTTYISHTLAVTTKWTFYRCMDVSKLGWVVVNWSSLKLYNSGVWIVGKGIWTVKQPFWVLPHP